MKHIRLLSNPEVDGDEAAPQTQAAPPPSAPADALVDDSAGDLAALAAEAENGPADRDDGFVVADEPELSEEQLMPEALVTASTTTEVYPHYEYVSLPRQLLRRVLSISPWILASAVWACIILLALATTLWVMQLQETTEASVPRTEILSSVTTELDTSDQPASSDMVPPVQANEVTAEPAPPGPADAMHMVLTTPTVTGVNPAGGIAAAVTPVNEAPDYSKLQVRMFGVPATASRIVFLVDTSGSLLDTLPYVLRELQKRIMDLSSKQHFTVIFFYGKRSDGTIQPLLYEIPPGGLGDDARGTPKRREKAMNWIDPAAGRIQPGLRGDAVAAIRKALTYKPEVIFLLSDNITGYGQNPIDQTMLLRAVRRANRGQAQIHTIQFVYEDPLMDIKHPQTGQPMYRRTLQVLAEQNDGRHVFITEDDLRVMDPGPNKDLRFPN